MNQNGKLKINFITVVMILLILLVAYIVYDNIIKLGDHKPSVPNSEHQKKENIIAPKTDEGTIEGYIKAKIII